MSGRPWATGDRHDLVLAAGGEGKLREIGDQLEAPRRLLNPTGFKLRLRA
jgi:hypothetical protein